jgi:hypothetical protein
MDIEEHEDVVIENASMCFTNVVVKEEHVPELSSRTGSMVLIANISMSTLVETWRSRELVETKLGLVSCMG